MKLGRKRLLEEKPRKTSVKYLGAQTDENLNWKDHLHETELLHCYLRLGIMFVLIP